jgi:hypothetical protein
LQLHFLIAAHECPFTRLGAEDFRTTDFAFISFSKLTHGNHLLLFQFHRLSAALYRPVAAARNNDFRPAFGAFVSFAYLICHVFVTPS